MRPHFLAQFSMVAGFGARNTTIIGVIRRHRTYGGGCDAAPATTKEAPFVSLSVLFALNAAPFEVDR